MTVAQGTRIVALYPRVSRSGKRDLAALERHTLAEQQQHAALVVPGTSQLIVDERYRDVNVSGKNFNRPGFEALVADIEAGLVHDVAVGYLSRFGRNAAELLANLDRLHALGATVYFGKEMLIAAPGMRGMTKLLVTILAAVAEMDLDRLEDGLKHSNAVAIADGISIQVPYGYVRENGPGSVLVFDLDTRHGPAPADVVRRIFALAECGCGMSEIANKLNDEHVLTPTALEFERGLREKPGARSWRHNTVANIIATRTYKGIIPRATQWADEARKRPTAWEELPARHEALIDDDVWRAAQNTPTRATRNGSTGGALLTSLVRCATCSRTMRPSSNKQQLTYVCPNKDCARRARITRGPVDEIVVERLLEDRGAWVERAKEDRQQLLDASIALNELSDEYDTFLSRAGALPADRFARANADYLKRLEAARSDVASLEARTQTGITEQLLQWDALDLDRKRVVLTSLLDAVVVLPAPGRGNAGVVGERVVLVPKGTAPFALSGTGRVVEPRPWPL